MKIAYQHLLRFLPEKPSLSDISDSLYQLGHEHEIENEILNFEFTPNRGDCLSLLGLSRDLNSFFKTNLDLKYYKKNLPDLDINFLNKAQEKCPKISFLNIEIRGDISGYKDYLEKYFTDLGIPKNNFFTDVSNYIAYEMGQPTHSYDFKKISKELTLTDNLPNTTFTTLHGNKIELEKNELAFLNNSEVINLAGIMGGLNSACSKETKSALVECAYFKPDAIIGKAIKYNLHSEASYKFERGVDPKNHEKVLRRFIQIVEDHVEIVNCELFKQEYREFEDVKLDLDLNKINNILGTRINSETFKKSLQNLGFKINDKIGVPSYRSDVCHQNDIAEEIARVIGYDNIPLKKIKIKTKFDRLKVSDEDFLKSHLIKNGFSEVINFPFSNSKTSRSIKVDNPLDSSKTFLRTSLVNSLLSNLAYNENRQKDSIKLFEMSDLYYSKDSVDRQKKMGIVVSGRVGENYKDFSRKLDRKYLQKLFSEIDLNIDDKIESIDRKLIKSKFKTPVFFIEILIEDLDLNIDLYDSVIIKKEFAKYKKISDFPSSTRDLSFSIKNHSEIETLTSTLDGYESDILKKSFMFDFYHNQATNEIKIGYRFIFQSFKRTLTENEVETEINKIIEEALKISSVCLPGQS